MKNKTQTGSALVELVIVLPLLLFLLGGMIDFGILFYNKQVITNASREAARAGIADIRYPDGSPKFFNQSDLDGIVGAYCKDRLISFGTTPSPTAEFSIAGPLNNNLAYYNNYMTVTVKYNYSFFFISILRIFGADFGPTMDISAQTVMQIERAAPGS